MGIIRKRNKETKGKMKTTTHIQKKKKSIKKAL